MLWNSRSAIERKAYLMSVDLTKRNWFNNPAPCSVSGFLKKNMLNGASHYTLASLVLLLVLFL
jgi:hypothetical protein